MENLKISLAENEVYPVELINQCRETPMGIVRLNNEGNVLEHGGTTLLEQLQLSCGQNIVDNVVQTPMDVCHILAFTFDKEKNQGVVETEVNLVTSSPHISLGGMFVDIRTHRVLGSIPTKNVENQAMCRLSYGFSFDQQVDAESLAILVDANWKNGSKENHLVLERDYIETAGDLQYEHMQPDKESEAVEIIVDENYEKFYPSGKVYKGDETYIVMSFIREPANKDDVDYILRVKRGPHANPMFAVPGKGLVWMEDAKLCWEKGVTATCIVTKVGGGGGTGAVYQVNYPSKAFLEYGDGMMYLMHFSWNQEYMGPGDMRPTFYDYHLTIDATFQPKADRAAAAVHTQIIVSSQDIEVGTHTIYKKIPKLQILWGCLAENTRIMMADHTQKPIRDIQIGEFVLGTDGSAWRVYNVWRGVEFEPMIRLRCRTGETVLMTQNHVILTDAGLLRAGEVTRDIRVAGQDGWLEIEEVYAELYDGTVYNLDIDTDDGRPAQEHLMLAGGIVVGDNQLQNTPLGR